MENVRRELRLFGEQTGKPVSEITVSSNYSLSSPRPDDAGIAVYFEWDGDERCVAVDKYEKIEDNLQAIVHIIDAERVKMRHGGLEIVRASFLGLAAITSRDSVIALSRPSYRHLLGLPEAGDLTEEQVKKAYRDKIKVIHPERGGDPEETKALNFAYKKLLTEVNVGA